jgi:hypothetical protein
MNFIPLLSTLVTFGFAAAVLRRYFARRGPHLLLWTVGLVLYGLGTLFEVILSLGFNGWVLKGWYLCGAMLTAAWLGQGTLHLLVRKGRTAWWFTAGLALVSLIGLGLVAAAPLTSAAAAFQTSVPVSTQYKAILVRSGGITALTILFNIYGTITMVGGAIYSAYLFWRKQVLIQRVIGNILIAGGALFPAMAGSFVKAGLVDGLYISELLGAILMFIGFINATAQVAPQPAPAPNAVQY